MARKLQEVISDTVIGMSDGLTVPFALAAGLSSTHNIHLVVIGGIAEISAGVVSMGFGGWQAAQAEDQIEGSETKTTKMDSVKSGITVGVSYAIGGIVPLIPYFVCSTTALALTWSIVATLIVLFIFGLVKGRYTKQNIWRSAVETLVIGAISASVAYLAAHLVG